MYKNNNYLDELSKKEKRGCKKTAPRKPRFTSNGESRLLNSSNRKK